MADSYTTLNTMLMANHIPPATAEQIICDTLRFLQFQSICDTLRADRNKYIRWLSLSRQMLHPAEFAREITKNLCHCRLDEESYHLMGKWLLAFFRKKDCNMSKCSQII